MINPKDLMLGNWVYDGDSTLFPMQVVGIGNDYVYLNFEGNEGDLWDVKPEDILGIPLTKDILLSCGFVAMDNLIYKPKTSFEILGNNFDGWHLTYNCAEYIIADEPIRYVHELQNQYYSLTKQTLIINL